MRIIKPDRLYCFSPPVMLVTFAIEIVCAVYVLYRYKLTPITRLAVALLIGLAVFQWAEYNICVGAMGIDSLTWARVGHVAITLLPAFGIHLATRLAGQKRPVLIASAYILAAVFSGFFMFVGSGITAGQCLGNYVIFDMASWAVFPYTVYYYGLLALGIAYTWRAGKGMKSLMKRRALYALMVAYVTLIVPTTLANIIDPSTIAGIPSIMCGFAVILAIIVTTVVVPSYYKKR